ncbi:MAG: ComF family protein, partial [Bacteroidia bacterium]|nr:ComF family protein [Bacteroidia bacterium]
VIPVPLHKTKLRKRGYNQVSSFAKEIATALNSDYMDDVLVKRKSTSTQVFKKRWARWASTDTVFTIENSNKIRGKHILLVDDIITTGATIESCAAMLQKAKDVKISVASMAIAE